MAHGAGRPGTVEVANKAHDLLNEAPVRVDVPVRMLVTWLCVWVEKEEEVVVVTRNTPRNTHHTHFISPTRSPSRALSMRDFTVH